MKRTLHPALLAALFGTAACASGTETIQRDGAAAAGAHEHEAEPAAHQHEPAAHQHAQALPATGGPGYTAADVRFMQDMIGHHAQALVMAELAPARAAAPQLLQLAEKIDISQRDEIAMMKQWLTEREQAVPDSAHMHAMDMPGMLTPAQLAQLEAARGRAFDRLFLTLMIQHHRGALHMVDALFASPGAAQDSEIFRFATDVGTDQFDEIDVMYYMLEILAATSGA